MKVHCYNILLFSFTLIILLLSPSQVNNQMNHYNRAHMKNIEPTKSYRSLYECGLYSPANNDNDPEMKRVMQQFEDRTSQRFLEYDERMQSKRMQCKEQCDKEIQKIILKDKLEKQMEQQLTTLETKIDTDDIPTCVCEKSLADKVEKGCLRCGYGLGTVAPTVGLIGAVAVHVWKPLALKAAIAKAIAEGTAKIAEAAEAARIQTGVDAVISGLKALGVDKLKSGTLETLIDPQNYTNVTKIGSIIRLKKNELCALSSKVENPMCHTFSVELGTRLPNGNSLLPDSTAIPLKANAILTEAKGVADAAAKSATDNAIAEITEKQTAAINTIFMGKQTAIIASIVAIVVIIYNQRNHKSTTHHTLKIPITRLLCECELYAPSNYDNDPQMKRVMQQFVDRTTQRFHEYDERMKTTRQKCKEKCDKEIQKIILKDKLEKELMDKFATLHTDIQSDAIPTCVCEKSLADKVEKNYMKCTQNLGGIVAPSLGVLGGIAEGALSVWKPTALKVAIDKAIAAGAAMGKAAGDAAGATEVIDLVKSSFRVSNIVVKEMGLVINAKNYNNVSMITEALYSKINGTCLRVGAGPGINMGDPICDLVWQNLRGNWGINKVKAIINEKVEEAVAKGTQAAEAKATQVAAAKTPTLKATNIAAVDATYASCQTVIIASIVAILVIVLVMVIIYLILRYRRKKKMKKKLQYIKLLEE
ncbi:hypothetical protein C923_03187 [Plasmodium falciparum UGT5.1]|uniref:Surface antigen n=1 Tax=Plasmodium falciparum UGT5.1 TaxID=1237627 RepID=W7JBH9_PLAFA|nr:hypothetical protein C923_03187 [Plasmodium falciparum UGT5.1]